MIRVVHNILLFLFLMSVGSVVTSLILFWILVICIFNLVFFCQSCWGLFNFIDFFQRTRILLHWFPLLIFCFHFIDFYSFIISFILFALYLFCYFFRSLGWQLRLLIGDISFLTNASIAISLSILLSHTYWYFWFFTQFNVFF